MVEWATETARRGRVLARVEFKGADAQTLPFDDATFDAVICESVLAFVPDKAKALGEFICVCRPGGHVGMNEGTWLGGTTPSEIASSLETLGFGGATLSTLPEWRALLANSGLAGVVMRTYHTTAREDVIDRLRWFGISGILRNISHMLSFAASSPANRAVLKRYFALQRHIP